MPPFHELEHVRFARINAGPVAKLVGEGMDDVETHFAFGKLRRRAWSRCGRIESVPPVEDPERELARLGLDLEADFTDRPVAIAVNRHVVECLTEGRHQLVLEVVAVLARILHSVERGLYELAARFDDTQDQVPIRKGPRHAQTNHDLGFTDILSGLLGAAMDPRREGRWSIR